MMKKDGPWLITGGAGYIGAHIVRSFIEEGIAVIVLDNLSTGIRSRIPDEVPFVHGDCSDESLVNEVLTSNRVSGIVHLAAFKHARESTHQPIRYWSNNLKAMLGIISAAQGTSVRYFLLSSSCSIFGASGFVDAETKPNPQSPYARSKYVAEQILADCSEELGLSWLVLRYFNVIGNSDFAFSQDTSSECLVPNAYRRIQAQKPPEVFGTNFNTPDGTALRDYVDVRDLAAAHVKAANYLIQAKNVVGQSIAVGTGTPHSVLEVIKALYEEAQQPLKIHDCGQHPADPDAVWADASPANTLLDWSPAHALESSIKAHVNSRSESSKK